MSENNHRPCFHREDGVLFCEGVSLLELSCRLEQTTYVYSRARIERNYLAYEEALADVPHAICYAMKANSTAGVLQVLARLGAGVDTVSGGEIARALRAGFRPEKIVYSGVGKTAREITFALKAGIGCFNVESEPELERINRIATELGVRAPISIRCNPDVDPKTHPYISTGLKNNKFGIAIADVEDIYLRAANMPGIEVKGIDAHIGSQITEIQPYLDSVHRLLDTMSALRDKGLALHHLDMGGGLGIQYRPEDQPLTPQTLLRPVRRMMEERGFGDAVLIVEPGRSIVGDAGLMLTQVEYIKQSETRNFCIVDGAMTDLIRPALYSAWMDIVPVVERHDAAPLVMDVVGPVCESSDFLGRARELAVREGDWIAVCDAGAYGASMASRYNSRMLPMEVMIDGERVLPLRTPDTFDEMVSGEVLLEL